jgi:uncharacterized tellurite resistance protein B-like protein
VLDRLLALLDAPPRPTADTVAPAFPRQQLAVVALLVELAQSDRRIGARELATIERIVAARFRLDAASTARLIAASRQLLDAALEDWVFAHAVREGFDAAARADIVGALWEVVYADGSLAPLEETLIERLAAQLRVGRDECEAARAQAFARSARARPDDRPSE